MSGPSFAKHAGPGKVERTVTVVVEVEVVDEVVVVNDVMVDVVVDADVTHTVGVV